MDRDLAKLSELAAAEIDDLRADGIDPTPAEVVRLNWLAWQVETPGGRLALAAGVPVHLGGAVLWPMTLAGSEWFQRVGLAMRESLQPAALAYAMAHGRPTPPAARLPQRRAGFWGWLRWMLSSCHCEPDWIDALALDGRAAEKAVRGWQGRLRATQAELIEAVSQIIQQCESDAVPRGDDGPGMSAGELSAFLCAACGGPAEVWERQCSITYALGVLRAIAAQARADGKPIHHDARIEATRALGIAVHEIRESRKAVDHGA